MKKKTILSLFIKSICKIIKKTVQNIGLFRFDCICDVFMVCVNSESIYSVKNVYMESFLNMEIPNCMQNVNLVMLLYICLCYRIGVTLTVTDLMPRHAASPRTPYPAGVQRCVWFANRFLVMHQTPWHSPLLYRLRTNTFWNTWKLSFIFETKPLQNNI